MRNLITTEIVNGVLRLVEYIKYTNGKQVKRVLDIKTGMPVDIIDVQSSAK
jgi:hypothetical protein